MVYIERSIIYASIKLMQKASKNEKKTFDKYDIEEILEKFDIHPKDKIKEKILNLSNEIHHYIFKVHGEFDPNKEEPIYSFTIGMLELLEKYEMK